jgi:hypothetical protein
MADALLSARAFTERLEGVSERLSIAGVTETLGSRLSIAAEQVTSAAAEISTAAQQRVTAEIRQFEAEAAKKESWRLEQERASQVASAAAGSGGMRTPESRRLVFAIDEEESPFAQPSSAAPALSAATRAIDAAAAVAAAAPAAAAAASSSCDPSSSISSSSGGASEAAAWRARLEALMTIMSQEAALAARAEEGAMRRMPASELLLQLEQLRDEVSAAMPARPASAAGAAAAPAPAGRGGSGGSTEEHSEACRGGSAALHAQIESLSASLAKAQLELSSKCELHRREVERLEARCEAAESEMLDRMRMVAEAAQAEQAGAVRAQTAEEQLAEVRQRAGARLKALIASNKSLDEEVARLREVDELNQSKIASLTASLQVVETSAREASRTAAADAKQQLAERAYARALVVRYLELEDQHEALFPALASAFRLTQDEVQRIQRSQQQHASASSLWGRTVWAGSRLVEAARVVASEAKASSGSAPPPGVPKQ